MHFACASFLSDGISALRVAGQLLVISITFIE